MDVAHLQARLAEILEAEEGEHVEWARVEHLCLNLAEELDSQRNTYPEAVAHYLSDSDIRARDPDYGDGQRAAVRQYLTTGEYDDGVVIPLWGCVTIVLILGAAMAWLPL